MPKIEIDGSTLHVEGKAVEFSEEIDEVLEYGDLIVVLLQTLGRKNLENNVWALDDTGTVQWKIEPAQSREPFTGLWTEDSNLWVYNWDGFGYEIDPNNGEILDRTYMK